MIRPIGIALSAVSVALAAAPVIACETSETAAQPELRALPSGAYQFAFEGWQGPDLPVWTYLPADVDPATAPIVIVMHGARRDADRYRDQWIEPAKAGGFIIVAPEFARSDFPKSANYNLGWMFEGKSTRKRDEALWAFSAIEPLFDEVVARLGGSQKRYSIYGHSAGSQFVHRFLFFKPGARVKRYLAANAGWYTLAQPRIAFPYGLAGTQVDETRLKDALAKDLVILLGDQDTDPNSKSLNKSEGAMKQGPHRLSRGVVFYATAKAYAKKKGWDFGWSIQPVKGVAHSNGGMAPTAASYVE